MRMLLSCWLLMSATVVAASEDVLRTKLQQAVAAVQQREAIQGVAAGVVTPDGAWTITAGESHPGVSIRPDMMFGIGSNTKTLTALVLLRLQEQGLLDLDDRIGAHVPASPVIDTSITIRQLLQHTSGLGEFAGGAQYRDSILANLRRIWKPTEFISMIPAPQFAPGTSWSYCNTNYLLAGIIAERIGNAPYNVLLQREVFSRAGVDSMVLVPYDTLVGELAHRWMGGRDAGAQPMQAEWSGAWAAGAVVSTAGQMARLYEALFAGRVVNAASMQEMLQFVAPNDYGLGISRKRLGGQTIVGHGGEIRGYSSVMVWVPSLKASISVLTNQAASNASAVADTIIRLLGAEVTSVQEQDVADGTSMYPCVARDVQGRVVGTLASAHALATLPAGMYHLQSRSSMRCVCVLADGTVAYGRTTPASTR